MPGIQPPAPKERPAVPAGSPAPRLPLPVASGLPVASTLPVASKWAADDYGAVAFIVLVVLGLVAASRAFLLLGA